MKKRISNYISLLLILSSFLLTPFSGYGQVHKAASKEAKEEKKEEVPFYQGTSIGVEIAGLVSNFLGSDIMSSEVAVQANFKNRFLPVVEIGYGKADAINEGMTFITKRLLLISASVWIIMYFIRKPTCRAIYM